MGLCPAYDPSFCRQAPQASGTPWNVHAFALPFCKVYAFALPFAGVIAVLAATLLDGWCHWSLQKDCTPEEQESQPLCFGFTSNLGCCYAGYACKSCPLSLDMFRSAPALRSQFSSLSFWSFRATSVAAGSFARSLNSTAVTFLTHGSALPVSSVGSQQACA